ncbi:DEAD/DEAH box helicase [Leptospira congkakensis]|uniref:DEAD/DEAH box helicase n=1 Tax=Leptospira congkakensis TaxID=2484932 RepID=A0A4Z1A569_9LEPT|nr:DEAD/DEAH box helicase [Leptospira congkakensis]TGL90131.1 DEAD/DEAH box helicase [Leptospira congkakensis]TGL91138.1 DEAD/DEAH box helicase [Leptospira congkakensis]TGL98189.1 DEAD/DEAH box helicase [Leptospira congkakensis]
MKFNELPFHESLTKALDKIGYTELTPIQAKSIPFAMEGNDLTGLAQTGTGKTMAFLLPTLHRLLSADEEEALPYALVLAPTRELTIQIAEEAKKLLEFTDFGVATIIGGTDYKSQEQALGNKACLIVATPGRLIDFVKNHGLSLENIKVVILDEADRMFDMGFVQDLKYIFHKCKNRKQSLLFSATLSYEVVRLASKYLNDPIEVHINPEKVITERIDQSLLHLGREEKLPYLVNSLLHNEIEGLGIIFTNYKMNIPKIVSTLRKFGITATGLSSELDQKKRIRLLRDFKEGKYKYLIATDVASRGIDIENIDVVYNYDLPQDAENYVHRIGRTARAGRKGQSIGLCSETDYTELERIEKYLNSKIPIAEIREEYLEFPKGEFTPVFADEAIPGEKKYQDRERGDRGGRGGKPKQGDHHRGGDHRSGNRNDRSGDRRGKGKGEKHHPPAKMSHPHHHDGEGDHKHPAKMTHHEMKHGGHSKDGKGKGQHKKNQSGKHYQKNDPRRNLFDINEVKKSKKQKQSIWQRILSIFKKD